MGGVQTPIMEVHVRRNGEAGLGAGMGVLSVCTCTRHDKPRKWLVFTPASSRFKSQRGVRSRFALSLEPSWGDGPAPETQANVALRSKVDGAGFWSQGAWVQIPARTHPSCVPLSQSFNFSDLISQFLQRDNGGALLIEPS